MKSSLSYLIIRNKDKRTYNNALFNELKGYKVTPKNGIVRSNMIKVDHMNVIDPLLIENLLQKKIEKKIEMLIFKIVNVMDSDDDGDVQKALTEAERIKYILVNEYSEFLEKEYIRKMSKKLDIIVDELRVRMLVKYHYNNTLSYEEEKGKSR